jgi:hypothetical protein
MREHLRDRHPLGLYLQTGDLLLQFLPPRGGDFFLFPSKIQNQQSSFINPSSSPPAPSSASPNPTPKPSWTLSTGENHVNP